MATASAVTRRRLELVTSPPGAEVYSARCTRCNGWIGAARCIRWIGWNGCSRCAELVYQVDWVQRVQQVLGTGCIRWIGWNGCGRCSELGVSGGLGARG